MPERGSGPYTLWWSDEGGAWPTFDYEKKAAAIRAVRAFAPYVLVAVQVRDRNGKVVFTQPPSGAGKRLAGTSEKAVGARPTVISNHDNVEYR